MLPWELDEPIELGNGLVVCRAHLQVICAQCCVDYSFLLEEDDEQVMQTGFATAVEEERRDDESEGDDDHADIMLRLATQNASMTRAQLQYRDDGTLIVPNISSFVPP